MLHQIAKTVVPRQWQAFMRSFSPSLVAEIIPRGETGLPDWFMPGAPVALASDTLLEQAGYRIGMRRPDGWRKVEYCYVHGFDREYLFVRPTETGLWMPELWNGGRKGRDADRVLAVGPMPLATRTYQAAMCLTMYCDLRNRVGLLPFGMHWTKAAWAAELTL